jgi:hypothetical protein
MHIRPWPGISNGYASTVPPLSTISFAGQVDSPRRGLTLGLTRTDGGRGAAIDLADLVIAELRSAPGSASFVVTSRMGAWVGGLVLG